MNGVSTGRCGRKDRRCKDERDGRSHSMLYSTLFSPILLSSVCNFFFLFIIDYALKTSRNVVVEKKGSLLRRTNGTRRTKLDALIDTFSTDIFVASL